LPRAEVGKSMSRSGFANSASTVCACASRDVRARFFVGRLERGSADVGIDSGIGSDIVVVVDRLRRSARLPGRWKGRASDQTSGVRYRGDL
jgi:hypothetical protein